MLNDRISKAISQYHRRQQLPLPHERREIRCRLGLSQGVIAEALGVSRAAVSRYEAGTSAPRGDTLEDYVELLGQLAAAVAPQEMLDPAGTPGRAETATPCRHDEA